MPEAGERNDPFPTFRYEVRVGGDSIGGFSAVSGLDAEIDVLEIVEGGLNEFTHRLPGRAKHGKLTLRRGLATITLWEWFMKLLSGEVDRRRVTVELQDPSGATVGFRWVFSDAFPSKWQGPDLSAGQSAIAVEAVELSHHGFSLEEG